LCQRRVRVKLHKGQRYFRHCHVAQLIAAQRVAQYDGFRRSAPPIDFKQKDSQDKAEAHFITRDGAYKPPPVPAQPAAQPLQPALPECIADLLKLTQKPEGASLAVVLQSKGGGRK
jgi:hypothetical protein